MSTYDLNRLMYDLRRPECRDDARADFGGYLSRYHLSDHERNLLEARDWQGLIGAGASIYVLTNLGATFGIGLLGIGARMRGLDLEGLQDFLAEQGRRAASHALLVKDATNRG